MTEALKDTLVESEAKKAMAFNSFHKPHSQFIVVASCVLRSLSWGTLWFESVHGTGMIVTLEKLCLLCFSVPEQARAKG